MPIVTLNNGRSFRAETNVSILDAARSEGVVLQYSCRTGRCQVCKAAALSGCSEVLQPEATLSPEDLSDGFILTCCRAATSDLHLDIEPLDQLAGLEIKTMPARIASIDRVAPDIVRVVLRTPPASPLRFLAGQYVDVIAQGVRRSYSLANAPRADSLLELLIKRYPGGVLSEYFFERARQNDLLRIEGPLGTFFLRDDNGGEVPTDILFLATGTGIAPVKALLEELAADPSRAARHRLRVYWGNREAENFCWDPAVPGLDVNFHPMLSGTGEAWGGRRGYVHEAAIEDGVSVSGTVVYACGSDAMIADAREMLVARGLPQRRFFSDAFVSSS